MTHILVKIIHNQRGCIMKPRRRRRSMSYRNSFNSITARGSLPEYQKLWILRILWELGGHHEFLSSYGYSEDEWYHLVGTYDGSTARFYINGKLIDTIIGKGNFARLRICTTTNSWNS